MSEMIHLIFIILIGAALVSLMRDLFAQHLTSKRACPYCNSTDGTMHHGVWHCHFCQKEFTVKTQSPLFFNESISQETRLMVELFAKITKSDGLVTKREIQVVDRLIKKHYHPKESQLNKIRALFNSAKSTPLGYEALLHKLDQLLPENRTRRLEIIEDLFQIALADDPLDERQATLIYYASQALHVGEAYANIRARYFPEMGRHYIILECSESDSLETIKKNYRRLIKEHHPDRFLHQEASTDFIKLANQKIKDIHQAYEAIIQAKKQTRVN